MQIIVTGHGNFATGIESTVKLLAGSLKDVNYIDFTGGMSEEDIGAKLAEQAVKDKQTLFFCDLLGGTPYKQAATFKAEHPDLDVEVICGCNVGSLLEIALPGLDQYQTADELAEAIMESAKNGIRQFGKTIVQTEPDAEDGI